MGGCQARPQGPLPPRAPPPVDEDREKFPQCVAFQSEHNGNYLCYVHEGIQLSGKDVTSPYARFFMVPSKQHSGLVHIRSCYNSKYWMAQHMHDGSWVVGTADEAEEDLSKPTCTLLRTMGNRPGSIRFFHACMSSGSDMTKRTLNFSSQKRHEDEGLNAYTIHDLSQQVVLPRYLAFKGDNGMYLRARIVERHEYLEFSGRDIGDEAVVNTVHTNNYGTIRIRSNYFGKFWRRSPNWIWANSDDTTNSDDDTLFKAIKFDNFFALQNLGNNYFCKRLTTEGKTSCLNAGTPTITLEARLHLEEAVLSREIYNVDFDLSDARTYGKRVLTMATASAFNGTTSNHSTKLTLAYTETEKRTWDSSVTLKLGVVANIRTGVPFIVRGNVEVTADFSGSYSWGYSIEKKTKQKVAYEVTGPPNTRVTVTSIATTGSCDVPFSYMQRDTLIDGRQITYAMNDGLYTGVNCYDFKYVTSEEKIVD